MTSTLKLAAGLALGFALAQPASAELLQIELTGSRQASFQIDTTMPSSVSSFPGIGDQILYDNVPGTYGGAPGTATTISFGTGVINALDISGTVLGFTQFSRPAPDSMLGLFTLSGTPPLPKFETGTFPLFGIVSGASSIEISVIPEPSTWAMMLLGFAGLGFAGYRQTRKTKLQGGMSLRQPDAA